MIRNYICKCEEGYILPIGKICQYCGDNGIGPGGNKSDEVRYGEMVSWFLHGHSKIQVAELMKVSRVTVSDAIKWYKRKYRSELKQA